MRRHQKSIAFVVGFLLAGGATVAMPSLSTPLSGGGGGGVSCDPTTTACDFVTGQDFLGSTTFAGRSDYTGSNGSSAIRLTGGQYFSFNSSESAYLRNTATVGVWIQSSGMDALAGYRLNGVPLFLQQGITISSGFGTSPSMVSSNGSAAFRIQVGTGGVATTGVISFPTATNGWVVNCNNITNPSTAYTIQTAMTTSTVTLGNFSRTTGLAAAWTANENLLCTALAY